MRTRGSILGVLVAGALAAGCGGDELTAQQLRDQANQACREYAERVANMEPAQADDLEAAIDQAEPAIDELQSDLEDLEPPAELEERYNLVVEGIEAAGDRLGAIREAAEDEDAERLQRLVAEAAKAQDSADQAAQELGIEECI
ncbi:MAG TPA: hypothetical protein VGW11_12485 [Solirubrobacteraceae bacterium]|nr:hypothetical protein [Solirubrobacteraceae bacterium]